MTEREKPKVRVTFSENRRRVSPVLYKDFLKYFIILATSIVVSEFILNFSGILSFSINEALIDFFSLTASFIIIGFFTIPVMRTKEYKSRSLAILEIAGGLVSIQIACLVIFYLLYPKLNSILYFYAFIISEIVYQVAFNFTLRRYKFRRRFFSIQIGNGVKIAKNSDGYIESIGRSDLITDDIKKIIEDKIKGKISDNEFYDIISHLDSTKKEMVLSLISGIEDRMKNKHRL